MLDRSIFKSITETLEKYPIVALTGPRQSGKTTLLRTKFDHYRYVSLENPDVRSYAEEDTKGFLDEYSYRVIFDEVQRVPKIFSYLQGIVDKSQVMGQFILSGSQSFNLIENITQSLAGRVALFSLFPFDMEEMERAQWLSDDLGEVFSKGFYPAIFEREINQDRYYSDYLNTYVKRDVSQLVNIQNYGAFVRFIKICATRAGQILNLNNLARDAGVSHTTARNWLSILETSYIVFLLQPYFRNYSKRIVKSSKLYFYDTGLLCHLLDFRKGRISPVNQVWGNVFENMIVGELEKQNYHQNLHRNYWFWRDSHSHEIDLLYSDGHSLSTYEIKSSTTIGSKMFEGLKYFKAISDDPISKQTLIYGGKEDQKRTDYKVLSWNNTN